MPRDCYDTAIGNWPELVAGRRGTRRMMSSLSSGDDTLVTAVLHLVGQSRAYVHQVEEGLAELRTLRDERAERLVEALQLTLNLPARPGNLRHVEQAATTLLRSLSSDRRRDPTS